MPLQIQTFYCDCWALAVDWPLGFATETPFFGASRATRTLPSMRGIVSIWHWSAISTSKPVHLGAADFLVRHFAAAMKNHRANFVAFAEEADDLVLANLIIVLGGSGTKLYFLELRTTAALALFVRFFVGLVEIFAVVGDLANWRIRRGRNFHQIKPALARQFQRFERLHDAKLAAIFINHSDFPSADPFVNSDTVALPEAAFCDIPP